MQNQLANARMPHHHMNNAKAHVMEASEKLPVTPIVDVEPKFVEHLTMYKGKPISVCTTAGVLEGVLGGAYVDHLELKTDGKKKHIRYDQIVYFE